MMTKKKHSVMMQARTSNAAHAHARGDQRRACVVAGRIVRIEIEHVVRVGCAEPPAPLSLCDRMQSSSNHDGYPMYMPTNYSSVKRQ